MTNRRNNGVVVVGGGHAAGQVVAGLRQLGYDERIVLITEEEHIPYQRPPLSKQYLLGEFKLDQVFIRREQFYESQHIECLTGTRVVEIEPVSKRIRLGDGSEIGWETLILATGSVNRELPVPGVGSSGVHSLRSISDCESIKRGLTEGSRVAVIGGGFIGLEVAASCCTMGHEVVVLEQVDRLLQRSAVPEISEYFERLHESRGVRVRTGTEVTSIATGSDGSAAGVNLANGECESVELVIVGIGVVPNVELAERAGLACNNGIVVDEYCRTSHDDIFAIGDCTNLPSTLLSERVRLECVPNALDQARCVASTVAQNPYPNHSPPWNWSDQFDVKLQTSGFPSEGEVTIPRGEVGSWSFMLFHLKNDLLVGTSAMNSPGEFLASRKLIGKRFDPNVLADPDVNLRELISQSPN